MEHKLSELQERLLEMMVWFDKYCRENDLRYYIMGGTLLGAMRHGGFIPWDDDLDIGMPRKDYDRLAKIFNNSGNKYYLEMPDSEAKDFCYGFGKLYDKTTTLVEHLRTNVVRGIYIDIFPIDGIGSDFETSKKNYQKVKWLYNFYGARTAGVRKGRSFYKNVFVVLARLIPDFVCPERKVRMQLDRLCAKYDFDSHAYCGNLQGLKYEGEIVPKDFFGTPQEVDFEGYKLMMHAQPEKYLEHIYGNWKELPPKEKQVTHHDYVSCDLNKPFME